MSNPVQGKFQYFSSISHGSALIYFFVPMKNIYHMRNLAETYREIRQKDIWNSQKEHSILQQGKKQKLQNSKVFYLFKQMGKPGLNLTYKLSSFYAKQILTPERLANMYSIILSISQ